MNSDIAYRTWCLHRAECDLCKLAVTRDTPPHAGCMFGHSWLALYYSYRIIESAPGALIHDPVHNPTRQA